eukprot:9858278-Alexandrium_andersonii.AAC.1
MRARRGERERERRRAGGEATPRGERSWSPPPELMENWSAKSAAASAHRCRSSGQLRVGEGFSARG